MKNYYIIDFDSTFTQVEALDELARISLKDNPNREAIYKEIEDLTNAAMEGRLSFRESLTQRVKVLQANRDHLKLLVSRLKKLVSSSFSRNMTFFKNHADDVLIVSGGFKEFITPVVLPYHIKKENIYANTFLFDVDGNIVGYDDSNPLSEEGGKVKLLKQLKLEGDIFISIDRLWENAAIHHTPFEKEMLRVLSHGLFHLCGFKDKSKEEKKIMRLKEDESISKFYLLIQ